MFSRAMILYFGYSILTLFCQQKTKVKSTLINTYHYCFLFHIYKLSNRNREYDKRLPSLSKSSWLCSYPGLKSENNLSYPEWTSQKVFLECVNWHVKSKLSVVVPKTLIEKSDCIWNSLSSNRRCDKLLDKVLYYETVAAYLMFK